MAALLRPKKPKRKASSISFGPDSDTSSEEEEDTPRGRMWERVHRNKMAHQIQSNSATGGVCNAIAIANAARRDMTAAQLEATQAELESRGHNFIPAIDLESPGWKFMEKYHTDISKEACRFVQPESPQLDFTYGDLITGCGGDLKKRGILMFEARFKNGPTTEGHSVYWEDGDILDSNYRQLKSPNDRIDTYDTDRLHPLDPKIGAIASIMTPTPRRNIPKYMRKAKLFWPRRRQLPYDPNVGYGRKIRK